MASADEIEEGRRRHQADIDSLGDAIDPPKSSSQLLDEALARMGTAKPAKRTRYILTDIEREICTAIMLLTKDDPDHWAKGPEITTKAGYTTDQVKKILPKLVRHQIIKKRDPGYGYRVF